MKYGTIKQEATACRKAFKGIRIGALVWFCHHQKPLEILTSTPQERINFILKNKPKEEQAIRLHWFRPVALKKMPKWLQKACAEWKKAAAECKKADAEWKKADAECKKACAKWKKAVRSHNINNLVKKHLPRCPWNGESIV